MKHIISEIKYERSSAICNLIQKYMTFQLNDIRDHEVIQSRMKDKKGNRKHERLIRARIEKRAAMLRQLDQELVARHFSVIEKTGKLFPKEFN